MNTDRQLKDAAFALKAAIQSKAGETLLYIAVQTTHYSVSAAFDVNDEGPLTLSDAINVFVKDFSETTETDFVRYLKTECHKFESLKKFVAAKKI